MNQHPKPHPDIRVASFPIRGTLATLGLALAVLQPASAAYSWKDFQFGGFASQGYLKNDGHNDYLGNTSKGTFDFREYAVNASWSSGAWRVGAQAFGEKLGKYGNDEIKLDWATIDYQPAQWFGLRAGRVKMPRGLYNEALDLDSVRPFVLLPQSVYDNRLRDFDSFFDGGMVYGNLSLAGAGSLDYRLFYGKKPIALNSGASDYFNTDAPYANTSISIDDVKGTSLFWNTPVNGLKTGFSYSRFDNFDTVRLITKGVHTGQYGHKITTGYDRYLLSVEYLTGDWVFATEAGRENAGFAVLYPPAPPGVWLFSKYRYYYLSAARRINRWLELGAYYNYSKFTQYGVNSATAIFPTLIQGDTALSVRFDLNDHLIFKIEGHYMDGAGKIFNIPSYPQPVPNRDNTWKMIAAKVTYTF